MTTPALAHADFRFEGLVMPQSTTDPCISSTCFAGGGSDGDRPPGMVICKRLMRQLVCSKSMSTVRNAAGMCLVGNFKVFFPNDHAQKPSATSTNTCGRHRGAIPSHGTAVKSKRREAVLSTGIHATTDLHAERSVVHQMRNSSSSVFEHGAEVGAVADGQIARVGPRTRGHVDA